MKTMILAAVAVLAIGAGTAFAGGEAPRDGGFRRAAPASQPQAMTDRGTSPDISGSRSYAVQSQVHDAWQYNGLNGGGG